MPTHAPFPTILFSEIPIHSAGMQEVLGWMEDCIRDRRPRFLCTLNAAGLVWADKNPSLKKMYREADLAVCDSTVFYYALKLLGRAVPAPLEACQIMFAFLEKNFQKKYRFYFLGAAPEILQEAMENLRKKYSGIQIAGFHHGYFRPDEAPKIAAAIREAKPDCLFVGMSSPLKEEFLTLYKEKMGVPIGLGVGGGIDILAGKYRLAPVWLKKLGLAWAYRLLLEPSRMWKRYLTTNSAFLWLFFKTLVKAGGNDPPEIK